MTKLISLSTSSILLAGAIVGLSIAACDGPKKIGEETMGNADCEVGETMPAEDGCNTCTCTADGWACTELGCEEPEMCVEGEVKPAGDGCNECTCFGGSWGCTLKACEPDQCEDGETKTEDCNECSCEGGVWACTEKGCVDTNGDGPGNDTDDTGPDTDTGADTGVGVCGDGVVDAGEACDDGNTVDDDACPNDCGAGQNLCGSNDPLTVEGATIEGDLLLVDVSYGGGCEMHEITTCWDGAFAESFPVQAWVGLSHDANDDACDALISEARMLDISNLRTAYQDGYQTEHGTIVIHLAGWATALDYTF